MTIQVEAYVAHQFVQALRSGCVAGIQFGKVIIVGHSLGSVVVWEEAITYGDSRRRDRDSVNSGFETRKILRGQPTRSRPHSLTRTTCTRPLTTLSSAEAVWIPVT